MQVEKTFRIKPDHLIFVRTKNGRIGKKASNLAVNDIIYLERWVGVVQSVFNKKFIGNVKPLTKEGTLVVDDVWVSSHYGINNHELSDWLYTWYRNIDDWIPEHFKFTWRKTWWKKNLYGWGLDLILSLARTVTAFDDQVEKMGPGADASATTRNDGFVGNLTDLEDIYNRAEN